MILTIIIGFSVAILLKFLASKSEKIPSLSKRPRQIFKVIESDNIVDIKYKDVGFLIFTTVFYALTYFITYLAVFLPMLIAREDESAYRLKNIKLIGSLLSDYAINVPTIDILLFLISTLLYVGLLFVVPKASGFIYQGLSHFGGDKGFRWYKIQFAVFIVFTSLIKVLNFYVFSGMSLIGALISFVSTVGISLLLLLIVIGVSSG